MEDIINIVKSLEESSLFLKDVSETIESEAKEQKDKLLCILLGTLCASLEENVLARKGVIQGGKVVIQANEVVTVRGLGY